ncbi:hypothetical protein CEXT_722241 [Caerostris extrusa]|uniref:Uncharacterized protein n=1 Tax=Caerostris extrusa TaxID=172846 RepID=A0AAV4Y346_CAEEX|nr:hypothetical protein CEXT_722241 [Caerostris extrusa]
MDEVHSGDKQFRPTFSEALSGKINMLGEKVLSVVTVTFFLFFFTPPIPVISFLKKQKKKQQQQPDGRGAFWDKQFRPTFSEVLSGKINMLR